MAVASLAQDTVTIRTYRLGDEEAIVGMLNAAFPDGWGTLEMWRWKYGGRPGFDPRHVVVAVAGDRVVGCFHGSLEWVAVDQDVVVPAAFEGDWAIAPEYRGRGLADDLYRSLATSLQEAGVVLGMGFTERALWERFYGGKFGWSLMADERRTATKVLDVRHLLGRFRRGPAPAAADASAMRVRVDLSDLAPFDVVVGPGGIGAGEATGGHAVRIAGPQASLLGCGSGLRGAGRALGDLLRGRIWISGGPAALARLAVHLARLAWRRGGSR